MALDKTEHAILLLSCPDAKGIVAEVTHFIFTYNGNILHSDQHNDRETDTFFMRLVWDLADFTLPIDKLYSAFEPIAIKFNMNFELAFSSKRNRIAILVSKYDHCLYDLILRNKAGELSCDIALIMSNHEDLKEIADTFSIPFYYFPVNKENKEEVEKEELKILAKENIDLVVLARYMQIVSPKFVDAYRNRMINIHHSFLPAFVGARPYHQAYSRGVKIIGATSHYITEDLDKGPIIEQDVTRISHRDSVDDLVKKGRNLEKIVLSKAVSLHLEHRILVFRNKTIVFD